MTAPRLPQLLAELSDAFAAQDVEGLLALFSDRPETSYAGSEAGERATGPAGLRRLLSDVLAREESYSFAFPQPWSAAAGGAVCVLADGTGTATGPDGRLETFPYRITGVLVPERDRWVWLLLTGSEPTPAAD